MMYLTEHVHGRVYLHLLSPTWLCPRLPNPSLPTPTFLDLEFPHVQDEEMGKKMCMSCSVAENCATSIRG